MTLLRQASRNVYTLANSNMNRNALVLTKNLNPTSSSPTTTAIRTMGGGGDHGDHEHVSIILRI